MTKTPSLTQWVVLFALLAAAAAVHAAPSARMDSLVNEVGRAVAKTRSEAANSPARELANALQTLVWQVGDQWKDGHLDSVEQGLRSIIEQSPSEAIAEQARALLAQATAEKDERNARFLAATDEAMKRAAELCLSAKTPGELDTLLARFQTLNGSIPRARDARVQRAVEQTRGAGRFLKKWQEYLVQISAGNYKTATQLIEQLADDNFGNLIVPRSEMLLRAQAAETAQTTAALDQGPARLAQSIHTIEDVSRILNTSKSNPRYDDDDGRTHRFYAVLKHLQGGWFELKGGNSTKAIEVAGNSFDQVEGIFSTEILEAFSRAQRDLLLRALPVELGVSETRGPSKDEKAADYLQRMMQEAKNAQDWVLMTRVIDVYVRIIGSARRNSSDWLNTEKQAFNYFVVARNQEKAGDFEAALRSYEAAIRLPSHYLPAEEIGQRVEILQQKVRDKLLPPVEK